MHEIKFWKIFFIVLPPRGLKGLPCDTITLSASEPKNGPVIADGMDVYPNPTTDLINFEKLSFQQGRSGLLRLYNTHGSMVLESAFPREQNTLQLSVAHLPAGMYVWACLNEQGLHVDICTTQANTRTSPKTKKNPVGNACVSQTQGRIFVARAVV